jgi:hypothetical protein
MISNVGDVHVVIMCLPYPFAHFGRERGLLEYLSDELQRGDSFDRLALDHTNRTGRRPCHRSIHRMLW